LQPSPIETRMQNHNSIVFLGDSLTEWFELGRFFPGKPIVNEGIAGDTTFGLLERLEAILDRPCSKIFLMIGINDVFNDFDSDDIIENLQLIIEEIQTESTSVELFVQSLLPVNESLLGTGDLLNRRIRHINKELGAYCRRRSLRYLDLYPAFLENGEMKEAYTTDGGHLSEAGYRLWAEKLEPLL